jgi:hypothetical protein
MPTLRASSAALLLWAALFVSGCGGCPDSTLGQAGIADAGGAPATQGLTVPSQTLPTGKVATPYPGARLRASKASPALTWSVVTGILPAGIVLQADGDLTGSPQTKGIYSFTVAVSDGLETASRQLQISVDTFGFAVEGLRLGSDAWSDVPLTLTSFGRTGSANFALADNRSGGRILSSDGTVCVYVPGHDGSRTGCTDVVRATDSASGATFDLGISVLPHPAADFVVPHSASDIWYVDFFGKHGSHSYSSDFEEVLASAGLHADGLAGMLSSFYVRRETLKRLRTFYGDLPISFPLDVPVGLVRPAAGSWLSGGPGQYGMISVMHSEHSGLLGLAFQDPLNEVHESNTWAPGVGTLGVFPINAMSLFNGAYNNVALGSAPVNESDVPALHALVYGLLSPGGRYEELRRIGLGLANTLAVLLAHEIGHSVGLNHSSPSSPGSIMNSQSAVSPSISYAFTASDLAHLRTALPGAGRGSSPSKPGAAPTGIQECRLAPPPFPWAVALPR